MVTDAAEYAKFDDSGPYLEGWYLFPRDRQRMLDAIQTETHARTEVGLTMFSRFPLSDPSVKAVHFVSADSHWPIVVNLSRYSAVSPRRFDVFEFSASPLSAFALPLGGGDVEMRRELPDEVHFVSDRRRDNPNWESTSTYGELTVLPDGRLSCAIRDWDWQRQVDSELFAISLPDGEVRRQRPSFGRVRLALLAAGMLAAAVWLLDRRSRAAAVLKRFSLSGQPAAKPKAHGR
jgi:hypothetical protein